MSCPNCGGLAMPECGGPALLICVRQTIDAVTIPAWVTAVCVDDEINSFALFQDAAATVPLVGYTIGDRVPCPTSLVSHTCETAGNVNLCPDTITAINTIIDDQTASLNANIDAAETAIVAAIEASAVDIVAAVAAVEAAIGPGFNSVGAPLPANFDSLAQTLGYTSGNLTTIVKTNGVNTWTQTYSYTGSDLTGISAWVQS